MKPGATKQEIDRAYRRRCFELHSDRNPDPKAHQEFLAVQKARKEIVVSSGIGMTLGRYDVTIHDGMLILYGKRGAMFPFRYRDNMAGEPFPILHLPKRPAGMPAADYCLVGTTMAKVVTRASFLAMPLLVIEHPDTPYILGTGMKRWLLRRIGSVLHAQRIDGTRVRLGGYAEFTDAGGTLKTKGGRIFPPFEVPI